MNGVGESSNGRICQLPQSVIHHILMLLPIKDAARTAIMSTNWRGHWRSVPQLVFCNGFAQISGPGMLNKLILSIYQSLLVHDGPVTKFVLAIPGLTPCDGIDHIIVHLSGRGIQELTLEFSVGFVSYKLPSSLFTAPLLNRLELQNCLLMAPTWFVGFSKLTYLFLLEVGLPSDFFESFLPKCPMIKT
ncbi:unnamed protein product [Linum trigynum]|uniref:F-box domain-containing protein n=1 Tax=Linum trigynum TaxID=586398 RepID=A0AAV2F2G5_9ROSI